MDAGQAHSVAFGISGLLPLCAIGFQVIRGVLQADKPLHDIATQFLVEETRYLTCKKQLTPLGAPGADRLEALKKRAPEIQHATILQHLAQISNTFADAKVLHNYGLRIIVNSLDASKDQSSPKLPTVAAEWKGHARQLVQSRKIRMDFFCQSKFVVDDARKTKDLIVKLKGYLDSLLSTCTSLQMQTFTNILIPDVLSMPNVELLDKLFDSQKTNADPKQQAVHDLLRRTVNFAAQVKATQSQSFVALENKFRTADGWAVPSQANEIGTMAYGPDPGSQGKTQVYYIEWKAAESHAGGSEAKLEANIKSLAKIASLKGIPAELRVLPCLGAFKKSATRYGLVYQLPSHLRYIRESQTVEGDISRRRKPSSLLTLLQSKEGGMPAAFDLGSRIKLAEKIAQSVLLLQSVGWVHKNVCSQSILFFRACSQSGDLPSTTGRLDFEHPYICGFGQPRPDNAKPPSVKEPGTTKPSTPKNVAQIRKNLYQHPHMRESPQSYYQPGYDVYSLGCVMLEIGLWQSISSLALEKADESAHVFRDRLVAIAKRELPGQVGRIYAGATQRCLQVPQTSGGSQKHYSREVLQQVIEALGTCVI